MYIYSYFGLMQFQNVSIFSAQVFSNWLMSRTPSSLACSTQRSSACNSSAHCRESAGEGWYSLFAPIVSVFTPSVIVRLSNVVSTLESEESSSNWSILFSNLFRSAIWLLEQNVHLGLHCAWNEFTQRGGVKSTTCGCPKIALQFPMSIAAISSIEWITWQVNDSWRVNDSCYLLATPSLANETGPSH